MAADANDISALLTQATESLTSGGGLPDAISADRQSTETDGPSRDLLSELLGQVERGDNQEASQEDTQIPDQGTESFSERFNENNVPDNLKDTYRQMQADYTRKTQSIAEQRKQFESDPVAQVARYAANLAQTNPVALVQYLQQQTAEAMEYARRAGYNVPGSPAPMAQSSGAGALQPVDPDQVAYFTENEKLLYSQIQHLQSKLGALDQIESVTASVQQDQVRQSIENQFSTLGRELGIVISEQDKREIASEAHRLQINSVQQLAAVAKAHMFEKMKANLAKRSLSVQPGRAVQGVPSSNGNSAKPKPGATILEIFDGISSGRLKA